MASCRAASQGKDTHINCLAQCTAYKSQLRGAGGDNYHHIQFKPSSWLSRTLSTYPTLHCMISQQRLFSDPCPHNSHFPYASKFYTKSDLTNPMFGTMFKNQNISHKIPNVWLLEKNLKTSNRWSQSHKATSDSPLRGGPAGQTPPLQQIPFNDFCHLPGSCFLIPGSERTAGSAGPQFNLLFFNTHPKALLASTFSTGLSS